MRLPQDFIVNSNALFKIVQLKNLLNDAGTEFESLIENFGYRQMLFQGDPETKKFRDAKESFSSGCELLNCSYAEDILTKSLNSAKQVFMDAETMKNVFGSETAMDEESAKKTYSQGLSAAVKYLEAKTDSDADAGVVFKCILDTIISPLQEIDYSKDQNVCPYCGCVMRKTVSNSFSDEYVWGCTCGAYAHIDGYRIVGYVADKALHNKRERIKAFFPKIREMSCQYDIEILLEFSKLINKKLMFISDLNYLPDGECDTIISAYVEYVKKTRNLRYEYPKSHAELIDYFRNNGRLQAVNAYGLENGLIISPIIITDDVVISKENGKMKSFLFPSEIEYRFDSNILVVTHPSTNRETYQMYHESEYFLPSKMGGQL